MTFGRRPKILNVGLVGPWRGGLANHRVRVFWLIDSQEATARFDLLLVTFEGELPVEWAATLQRALTSGTRVRHVGEYVESECQRLTRTRFTSSDGARAQSGESTTQGSFGKGPDYSIIAGQPADRWGHCRRRTSSDGAADSIQANPGWT